MPPTVHSDSSLASVGTSGFSYPDWKGSFYPEWLPSRDWFHYYATQFNAVEINLTFYRSPTLRMIERWKEAVPPRFGFVLKASQVITHRKRLADCGEELERMIAEYVPLESRLSCVLFQLPPSLDRDDVQLERFFQLAAAKLKGASIAPRLAVEFRNPSWNAISTLDLLARHGCGMVIHDMERSGGWHLRRGRLEAGGLSLTPDELLARSIPLLYLRFHGTSGKYAGEYGPKMLQPWGLLARSALKRDIPVHAYFNNTQGGAAPRDALRFAAMLGA